MSKAVHGIEHLFKVEGDTVEFRCGKAFDPVEDLRLSALFDKKIPVWPISEHAETPSNFKVDHHPAKPSNGPFFVQKQN